MGKDNLHFLLDARGNLVTKHEEKVRNIFASIFNSKTGHPQDNWLPELVDGVREQNKPLESGKNHLETC